MVRRLYNFVTGAVAHARELEVPTAEKIIVLKENLRHWPCHVFGCHDSCKAYTASKIAKKTLFHSSNKMACATIFMKIWDGCSKTLKVYF